MFYKKVAKQFAHEIFITCKRNKHPKKSKKYPRSNHDPKNVSKYLKANPNMFQKHSKKTPKI